MTLGEKIKKLRTETNLSQDAMGEKLNVSRQAITKWESDQGLPDIENLKAIASLFNISIDELLDYKKSIIGEVIFDEKYSLTGIIKNEKCRNKEETIILNKFPKASKISFLLRKKKWSKMKWLFWFAILPEYSSQAEEYLNNGINSIYLVEEDNKQYLVTMKKGHLRAMSLKTIFPNKEFEINGYIYKKLYTINTK